MKDRVAIGHLTKYDAFRMNTDQAMSLEICFNPYKCLSLNVSNFETASPETI